MRFDKYHTVAVLSDVTINPCFISVFIDMEEKDVGTRIMARELPGCSIIMPAYIGDNVGESNGVVRWSSCWMGDGER